MLTRPSANTSTLSGCSKTCLLDNTDGYTDLVPNLPSNRKSILVSASTTSCPQDVVAVPAQRTSAHTCNRDVRNMTGVQ